MNGQMTIDDFLSENNGFSWDSDINDIYDKLNRLAKRFNIATEKAEWSVWDHVPKYGYRMSYHFVIGKCMENQEEFAEELEKICKSAAEKQIELSVLWGGVWWDDKGLGDLAIFSTFMDKERRKRRNEHV